MKAEELMLGDWVRFKNSDLCHQVYAVQGKSVKIDKQYWNKADKLQPIPITPEILEKNGFTWELVYDKHKEFTWHDNEKYVSFRFYGEPIYGVDTLLRCELDFDGGVNKIHNCHITHVHELQHALRLCGIDKEILL